MIKVTGIVEVTGETSVGKTAFGTGFPVGKVEEIAFFTFDGKEHSARENFGLYRSYFSMFSDTSLKPDANIAVAKAFMDDVSELIKKNQIFTNIVVDSFETWVKAFGDYFMKYSDEFKKDWHGGGKYTVMEKRAYAQKLAVSYLAQMRKNLGAAVVIAINHIKDEYIGDVKTNRKIPASSLVLAQKTSLRLWLQHNPEHPCPLAVVLKPLEQSKFVPGRGLMAINVLPHKLSPKVFGDYESREYISIWDIIEHYIENPVGTRKLKDFESLTEEEFSLISGTMTDTQARIYEHNINMAVMESQQTLVQAIEALGGRKPLPILLNELKEEFPNLTVPILSEALDKMEA